MPVDMDGRPELHVLVIALVHQVQDNERGPRNRLFHHEYTQLYGHVHNFIHHHLEVGVTLPLSPFGYKWRNWKLHTSTQETMGSPVVKPGMPRLYNLLLDMREDYDLVEHGGRDGGEQHYWVMPVIFKRIVAHQSSLLKEPPIAMGTPV